MTTATTNATTTPAAKPAATPSKKAATTSATSKPAAKAKPTANASTSKTTTTTKPAAKATTSKAKAPATTHVKAKSDANAKPATPTQARRAASLRGAGGCRVGTMGEIICRGLLAKKTDPEILAEMKKHDPSAKSNVPGHISWYRNKLRKQGLIPPAVKPDAQKADASKKVDAKPQAKAS